MYQEEQNILRDKALDFGIELSQQHLSLVSIYLAELIEWNRRINLTGLSAPMRIINELFLDSLIPVPFIPEKGRMLDVGSGAGFPGIPINIYYPRLKTHLMEASSKKVSFLKQVIRLIKLDDIKVIKGRIERNGDNLHTEGYNLITARALAGLDQIITWCSPFLSPDGLLVGFLGSGAERDLEKSEHTRKELSLVVYKKIPYSLPEKQSRRTLIILKKKLL
ncbi:16S rRNA (guanine(527)-N(7))-methyltransferase RsmG [Thermodesulfobacteriota bacterium]